MTNNETNCFWKDINGYEGIYQVSDTGLVKSLKRKESCGGHIKYRTRNEKILKPGYDKDGYLFVRLCKNAEIKTLRVHRLVAKTFLADSYSESLQVNHKNGKKDDNNKSNLEWCNQSENMSHAFNTGLVNIQNMRGENHSKLTEEQVKTIRILHKNGQSFRKIAKIYNVDKTTVGSIINGINWGWLI